MSKRLELKAFWEHAPGYSVIGSVIAESAVEDKNGKTIADQTLYDTLYRFLVLFGVPEIQFQQKTSPEVWKALSEWLEVLDQSKRTLRNGEAISQFEHDCKEYSIRTGKNKYIARARVELKRMKGGLDLLQRLCAFDSAIRATSKHVLDSLFMENLQEGPDATVPDDFTTVRSYTIPATHS